jgi:hypothetical protein
MVPVLRDSICEELVSLHAIFSYIPIEFFVVASGRAGEKFGLINPTYFDELFA